jgi:predicted dinucleotide-binding enzyme
VKIGIVGAGNIGGTIIGFAPVDTGTLREGGHRQQPGAPVYDADITLREAEGLLPS